MLLLAGLWPMPPHHEVCFYFRKAHSLVSVQDDVLKCIDHIDERLFEQLETCFVLTILMIDVAFLYAGLFFRWNVCHKAISSPALHSIIAPRRHLALLLANERTL